MARAGDGDRRLGHAARIVRDRVRLAADVGGFLAFSAGSAAAAAAAFAAGSSRRRSAERLGHHVQGLHAAFAAGSSRRRSKCRLTWCDSERVESMAGGLASPPATPSPIAPACAACAACTSSARFIDLDLTGRPNARHGVLWSGAWGRPTVARRSEQSAGNASPAAAALLLVLPRRRAGEPLRLRDGVRAEPVRVVGEQPARPHSNAAFMTATGDLQVIIPQRADGIRQPRYRTCALHVVP